jgi:putative tricarboxylic transport membrane protein
LKINDFLSGALLMALAGAILFHIRNFPNIPGQNIGPAAFPGLLAVLLAVCALALMARGWKARRDGPWVALMPWMRSPGHVLNFALAVAGLIAFAALSEQLGFIVSGVLLLAPLFLCLRVRPLVALALAIAVTLVIHAIFYKLLRVPLPWGVLEAIRW